MRRKAVAIVLADGLDATGGISRVMRYLVRQVAEDAPDIFLVVQQTRWAETGVARHLTAPLALSHFAARLIRRKIGVAHINLAAHGSTPRKMLFAKAARLAGAKIVLHLHGSAYDEFLESLSPRLRMIVVRFFRSADRVIVLGGYWRDYVRDAMGVDPHRLVTIDNGVPPAARLADPTSPVPTIVFAGVLGERKGVDTLLEALAILKGRKVPFKAVLCGGGPVDQYRDIAQRLGVAEEVTFRGWVDEAGVAEALADGDLFTLPSRGENQPVAILEAMARALPVVASSVGSIPEQVEDGKTGFVVPRANPEALADALGKLALDPAARQRMGQAGFVAWRERFSIEATARNMLSMYRDLLDQPTIGDDRPAGGGRQSSAAAWRS